MQGPNQIQSITATGKPEQTGQNERSKQIYNCTSMRLPTYQCNTSVPHMHFLHLSTDRKPVNQLLYNSVIIVLQPCCMQGEPYTNTGRDLQQLNLHLTQKQQQAPAPALNILTLHSCEVHTRRA
jgi:hypothetical protein